MNILVVDDAENVRYSVRLSLEDNGFSVDEAVDGEDALNQLATKQYDYLIIDIWMPRLNGIQLLQQLRKIAPSVPVIVITGGAARISIESTEAMARTWGAERVFYKPFNNQDLTDVLLAHGANARTSPV